jgi:hypothetical protein
MLAQRATRGGAHVNGALRGNERDDSKGFGPSRSSLPSVRTLRGGFAIAALAGCVALVIATFTTVIQITVGTTARVAGADTSLSGWDRHGPALIVLALLAVWLLGMALRGAGAAMAGLAAAGVAALAIAMIWDRPHVHDTGSVGDLYAEATADPASGYYLETLGGALLLLAGGGLLVLGPAPAPGAPTRRAPSDGVRSPARPASTSAGED